MQTQCPSLLLCSIVIDAHRHFIHPLDHHTALLRVKAHAAQLAHVANTIGHTADSTRTALQRSTASCTASASPQPR